MTISFYVIKDHIGSITTITNSQGAILQELSFDAWGNLRSPETWRAWSGVPTPMFDRGFTGHEHLCFYTNNVDTPWFDIGLINMNGRMYDPVMSSFLSVDNYVQCPDFSQNFNRYAYCLNNPLKYTDPSGEVFGIDDVLVAMAVSVVINVTMNGINNVRYGENFFLGAGKAAVVGDVQGLFSYGIGECAGAMDILFKSATVAKFAKAGFQLVAHGTVGGMSTMSRGGNFWHGFVSSATASVISGAVGLTCAHYELSEGWTRLAMVAAGVLSGGISAKMAGGDFIDGFCNGLICAGLNHALHYVVGPLNKGLAIAMVTGRIRHMFGPDAIAGAITMDATSGIALSAEEGGLYVLVGKDKGFYSYSDLGAGAGLVSVSAGVELVELYSSSPTSEVSVNDFTGSRWEANYSVTAFGINVGATAIYSNRYDENGVKTGYTIGIGPTVGVDAIPFKVGGNINYGASSTDGIRGLCDGLNKTFKLKQQ